MTCVSGLLAEDCAITHWSPVLGGRREQAGWRAPCPVCHSPRALEYDTPGRLVRWNNWCPCERETVRKALAELVPNCMPSRRSKTVDPAAVKALALAQMPPATLRLRMLELAGIPTGQALDMLGVRREHRSRVITGLTGAPKRVQTRRT